MGATTIKAKVGLLVERLLADGVEIVEVHENTYMQHCLREHPNVCRQELAGTGLYRLHATPCECGPRPVEVPKPVTQGRCCGLAQPYGAVCMLCDEVV